jgi:hypothetical protein
LCTLQQELKWGILCAFFKELKWRKSGSRPTFYQRQKPNMDTQIDQMQINYASKVIKHMIELTTWRETMLQSMESYMTKVLNKIDAVYAQGLGILARCRRNDTADLLLLLEMEVRRAEQRLQHANEQMLELIQQIVASTNSAGKRKAVLELLEEMRHPELPDISFLPRIPAS